MPITAATSRSAGQHDRVAPHLQDHFMSNRSAQSEQSSSDGNGEDIPKRLVLPYNNLLRTLKSDRVSGKPQLENYPEHIVQQSENV